VGAEPPASGVEALPPQLPPQAVPEVPGELLPPSLVEPAVPGVTVEPPVAMEPPSAIEPPVPPTGKSWLASRAPLFAEQPPEP
jgi:hypothetical protein